MRKAIIYMEVACGHCGGIINRNYKNSTGIFVYKAGISFTK